MRSSLAACPARACAGAATTALGLLGEASPASDTPPHTARLETGALRLVAADNAAYGAEHRAGYSGVAELALRSQPGTNLFVPQYAGLAFMMFRRPKGGDEIRFAQSPSGGGTGNPAWDFVTIHRGPVVGREFAFRARAVYRPFRGTEDLVHEYERWSGEKGQRPTAAQP
jgi:hypothetical protein